MLRESVSPAVILVVDDDEVVARVVAGFLRHLGYTVLEATSGDQALAIVQWRQPPIDLVLSDAVLRRRGGLDGSEFTAALLGEWPGPQLILFAGPPPEAVEPLGVQGRGIRVVRKPLHLDQLADLLREMLPPLLPVGEAPGIAS